MCGTPFPAEALFVCDQCLGPLEVTYDYDAIGRAVTRDQVSARPENLWRYRELLPVNEPRTGFYSGFTPLVKADRLARRLGVQELYVKDDSVNHPTFSYKDRVVSVAASRAVDLGFEVFACASTGNLANSVAAHAARLGLICYVFIPDNLEAAKVMGSAIYRPRVIAVKGNYDDINRLCTQIADRHGWGFANINLRTYYAEGAKTYGFEIAEQLGWRFPRHVVCPVAGGTLLPRIGRAFDELKTLGWVERRPAPHARGAGGRLGAGGQGVPGRRGVPRAGEAQHHREVHRHRQPGRRLSRAADAARDRRHGDDGERRGDPAVGDAAGRDRRHLHRAGRRRDAGRRDRAHQERRDPAPTSRWWCASPATATRRPTSCRAAPRRPFTSARGSRSSRTIWRRRFDAQRRT